ncbi:hypothetical protein NK213_03830 [Sebaldella sp. S0638]|nr:hypothetical protein [Sebaldella sp. S0638]
MKPLRYMSLRIGIQILYMPFGSGYTIVRNIGQKKQKLQKIHMYIKESIAQLHQL